MQAAGVKAEPFPPAPDRQAASSAWEASAQAASADQRDANIMRSGGWRGAIHDAGRWAVVVSLFCVPLNKPATSIALAFALLCSLLAPDLPGRLRTGLSQPVVRGALIWMGVLALSALHAKLAHGSQFPSGSTLFALSYPLLVATLLDSNRWRRRAVLAFCIAVTAVLLISWGQAMGIVPQRDLALLESGARMRNTVFKEYNQQGVAFLILASFAFSWFLRRAPLRIRLSLALIVLLSCANVLFLIDSRTALVSLLLLMAYFSWRLTGARQLPDSRRLVFLGACVVLIGSILWSLPVTRERVLALQREAQLYDAQSVATPTGARLEMWRQTLPMIASAPVFGHGLNQWRPMYHRAMQGKPNHEAFLFDHPHQEYLWILAEEGAVGLLIFAGLIVLLLRHVARLGSPERDAWTSLIIVFLSAGLSHCLWFDFAHRHTFILLLACIPILASPRAQPSH